MEIKIKNKDDKYKKNLTDMVNKTFAEMTEEPFKIEVKKDKGVNSPTGTHLEGKVNAIIMGYVSLGKDLANITEESDKDFFEFCRDIAPFMGEEQCKKE